MHCCAAWDALETGWKSMSAAADKTRDSLGANGAAVDRDGTVDMRALVAGAAVMAKGIAEMEEARAAFGAAIRLSRAEASERDMAAEAYGRAGASRAARAQRGRARTARKRGADVGAWESSAARRQAVLTDSMDAWKENIAMSAVGGVWDGDRAAWAALHATLRAHVEKDGKRWAWMAGKAAEVGAKASYRLAWAEAAVKRTARTAGLKPSKKGGGGANAGGAGDAPRAEAADAWLAAMRAAKQASSR